MTLTYLFLLLMPVALTARVLLRHDPNATCTQESCECCQNQQAEIERPLV